MFVHVFSLFCPLNSDHIRADPCRIFIEILHHHHSHSSEVLHKSYMFFLTHTPFMCLCSDRKMVSTHLPLAWTHSSPLEEQKLLSLLEDLAKMFQPH